MSTAASAMVTCCRGQQSFAAQHRVSPRTHPAVSSCTVCESVHECSLDTVQSPAHVSHRTLNTRSSFIRFHSAPSTMQTIQSNPLYVTSQGQLERIYILILNGVDNKQSSSSRSHIHTVLYHHVQPSSSLLPFISSSLLFPSICIVVFQ